MIQITGVDTAISRMAALAAKAEASAVAAARAAAEPIEAAAKARVPVVTGALRDSIHIETRIDNGVASADVIAGGPQAPYAAFVEFTPDEEPFLRPAADSAHDEAVGAVENVVKNAIR